MKCSLHKIFFFLFLFSFYNSFSQNGFAPVGAKWWYSYDNFFVSGYVEVESVKDTIINGIKCSKLVKTRYSYDYTNGNTYQDTLGFDYLYTDSNKTYYYRQNNFFTLYDFNAIAGSSWVVAGFNDGFSGDSTAIVEVDSTDSVIINSELLKRLFVSAHDSANCWQYTGVIVEKLGCMGYMFPEPFCMFDAHEGGDLRCYSYLTYFYNAGITDSCNFLPTNAENYSEEREYFIFPKIASEKINIHTSRSNLPYTVSVYDILGGLRYSNTVYTSDADFDFSDYAKGMYFLKINNSPSYKFIKP